MKFSERDHVAIAAMQGGMSSYYESGGAWESYEDFARSCYAVADAMLWVRDEKTTRRKDVNAGRKRRQR